MARTNSIQTPILQKQDPLAHHIFTNNDKNTLKGNAPSGNTYIMDSRNPKIAKDNTTHIASTFNTPRRILFNRIVAPLIKVSRIAVMVVLLLSCASCATKLHASSDEPIVGKTEMNFQQIAAFILDINPDFDPEIAQHYVDIGKKYGIRAEIAVAQAILETGWFKFKEGSAVKSDHHNYCGLGVTSSGSKGCSFDSAGEGVRAHIQHLFAYATDQPLPKGETLIDPRFKFVKRACAPSLSGLTGTWAMSNQYSKQILAIYRRMQEFVKKKCPEANQ